MLDHTVTSPQRQPDSLESVENHYTAFRREKKQESKCSTWTCAGTEALKATLGQCWIAAVKRLMLMLISAMWKIIQF